MPVLLAKASFLCYCMSNALH